jgi:hypothetical protein
MKRRKNCVISPYVLSLRCLPLPSACVFVTVIQARVTLRPLYRYNTKLCWVIQMPWGRHMSPASWLATFLPCKWPSGSLGPQVMGSLMWLANKLHRNKPTPAAKVRNAWSSTVRAPREFSWEWSGHERLRCTLSQNMRPLLHTLFENNSLHYWRLLEYNVFGIGIRGVRMRSKIIPSPATTCQQTSRDARTVPILFHHLGVCLIKHRNNFAFHLLGKMERRSVEEIQKNNKSRK